MRQQDHGLRAEEDRVNDREAEELKAKKLEFDRFDIYKPGHLRRLAEFQDFHMIKLEAGIRRLEARISRGHAQDIRDDILREGRLDTNRNKDIGIESTPLTGSLHLPAIEALEYEGVETNVSPPGTLYLPALILTSPILAHGLRSFLHQTIRLDRTINHNLTPSQHYALTQQRQHLPYLYNARLRAGKAPYNIKHVAEILDRLLFGGLLGLTKAENKGVSIARVMWARETSI